MYKLIPVLRLSIVILMLLLSRQGYSQDQTQDIWYVWIDTEVNVEGTVYRVISDKPIMISCCVKSAKYRKLVKNSIKWIKKNVSQSYDGALELMKLQDRELAEKIVSDIQLGITNSDHPVKVITYRVRCT